MFLLRFFYCYYFFVFMKNERRCRTLGAESHFTGLKKIKLSFKIVVCRISEKKKQNPVSQNIANSNLT